MPPGNVLDDPADLDKLVVRDLAQELERQMHPLGVDHLASPLGIFTGPANSFCRSISSGRIPFGMSMAMKNPWLIVHSVNILTFRPAVNLR